MTANIKRRSIGRRATTVALFCVVACASGCGSRDFREAFPADKTLENLSESHALRTVHFTFDPSDNPNTAHRGDTGKVTLTFGDAEEQFPVAGTFAASEFSNTTSPSATLTITYNPTEEQKAKYRELVKRMRARAKPGEPVKVPDELPGTAVFRAQVYPNRPTELALTDAAGTRMEFKRVATK